MLEKIIQEPKLDFKDVLILPRKSLNIKLESRNDVSLLRTFRFKYYPKTLTCVPIIASNMSSVGTISMAEKLGELKCLTVLHKYVSCENLATDINKEYTFLSCGVNDFKDCSLKMSLYGFDKVCVDIANGYLEKIIEVIRWFRENHPQCLIMAGNIVTPERCRELIQAGADIVKVGIGSGSACLTRLKTGVGYPQLSCVLECEEATHQEGGLIISDGGCSTPADICKAFGANADFVMLGGMLGGHLESEGEIIEVKGQQKVLMYGMSSKTAQEKFSGKMNEYRSSEGRSFLLDYRGTVTNTMNDIMGGLRSYGTYIGTNQIADFAENTQFIRVSQQLNNPYDK
jgi:GMP reductase